MGQTLEIGQRIELCSMDAHCQNITLGLYRREVDQVSQVLVHTYSSLEQARERVAFVTRALQVLAGLEAADGAPGWLRFPCSKFHQRALKRAFLDACKLASNAEVRPRPLTVTDKKAGCELSVRHLGQGLYQIEAAQQTAKSQQRAAALAVGYAKLCELAQVEGQPNQVAFSCRSGHDALMGALLFRAQNVRAAMREEESSSSRGVLAAPSQQK